MSDDFQKICDDTARSARKHSMNIHKISEAFVERYGINYSDADVDWLIDQFDYAGGKRMTVAEIDAMMSEAGFPPLGGDQP